MSNVYQFSSQDQRIDEASVWLYKVDKGLSDDETKDLKKWLSASDENQQLFLEMVEMWDEMDILSRLTDLFPQPVKHKSTKENHQQKWFPHAVAASLAVVVFSVLWGVSHLIKPDHKTTIAVTHERDLYQTAIGEHSTANLPDGTQIILNTNTLVKVSYTDKHRFLILERGELHVDVAHDESRPLSVIAGDRIVQAVGTVFNIELYNDQHMELVVTEGKVLVGARDKAIENAELMQAMLLSDSSFSVSEGHQLILGVPNEKVEFVEPDDIQAKLSWREGTLIFQGESLEEAIKEISRYTSVEFVLKDKSLKKIKVIGLFKAGDINGLLATLRDNFNISISHQPAEDKILLDKITSF